MGIDTGYASRIGLSIYAALYAALAISLKAKLVTADKRLSDTLSAAGFGKHVKWAEELG